MWKPGTKKPNGRNHAGNKKSPQRSKACGVSAPYHQHHPHPNNNNNTEEIKKKIATTTHSSNATNQDDEPTTQSPSVTPKAVKHLSGATLNMRFMQRHDQGRVSRSPRGSSTTPSQSTLPPTEATTPSATRRPSARGNGHAILPSSFSSSKQSLNSNGGIVDNGDSQNNEDDVDMDAEQQASTCSVLCYEVASPADMYGSDQVATIGRRSFGGFNPQIAEAWSCSQPRDDDNDDRNISLIQTDRQRRKFAKQNRGSSTDRNASKKRKTRLS
ncbi:hypothetical protein ACA910_003070 [Epithemia clementina (nom. ined.)]